ncbi:MAG: type IV secretion system DNA-binding domain-containing protein [Candidatus Paceibacteria bacterium]
MPTHHLKKENEQQKEEDVCLFGKTDFRDQMKRFGIKLDDRRRHMYVIGKTGMGKTTMLENMILQDIHKGHGVGLVDPHGDFAEKIVDYIPSHRINDVVYINPADREHPIGFNVLEVQNDEQKDLVASSLMGIFQKIWPDVWSSRMEYILNNTLLGLLHYPQKTTLLGINRMLGDKSYRDKIVSKIQDPVVKSFWEDEFAGYSERYRTKAVAAIQNKIGQFLSSNLIRNIVGQVSSTINTREIMDSGKIMIMNLSKGKVGEDNMRLLGGMFITKLQLSAMSRVDTPEHLRKDFMLYVDEFQNFATPSFANMLSEARKYRLSLIMAHQYIAQLSEEVRDAVFGNVGSLISFRVGAADAEFLEQEFSPVFTQQDLVNLSKYHIFLKLMIDGVASQPFSAKTLPPLGNSTGVKDKVVKVSRERYGRDREEVAEKIAKWSGKNIDHAQVEEDSKQSDDKDENNSSDENDTQDKSTDQQPEDKNQQDEDSNKTQHEAENTQQKEELSLSELKNKQDN